MNKITLKNLSAKVLETRIFYCNYEFGCNVIVFSLKFDYGLYRST